MRKSSRLPTRFPEGSKYVLEADGGRIHRYIEFPDGRKVLLADRKAVTQSSPPSSDISIVPTFAAEAIDPAVQAPESTSVKS